MFIKHTYYLKRILISTFFCLYIISSAQNADSLTQYYGEFDKLMGYENSELNFGKIYNERYRTYDKSYPYYKTNDFESGTINYNGQFYKTNLKYDIFNDLVVIKYIDSANAFNISLISDRIRFFTIKQSFFTRLSDVENLNDIDRNGFFEKVFEGKTFEFYIKHIKIYSKKNIKNTISYRFDYKTVYLIKYQGKYFKINNKKKLIKAFPYLKKEANKFFTKQKGFSKETIKEFLFKND